MADSAHISRRLRRLEWATRFRPVHIQGLLVGGIAPARDTKFLYSEDGAFAGEAGNILKAAQIPADGKPAEAVLGEFQKLGLMLTHVLECPLAEGVSEGEVQGLIEKQLPGTLARIRRSLKPKRVVLVAAELAGFAEEFRRANLECAVLVDGGGVFGGLGSGVEAFRAGALGARVGG
jgi:hypothetical protein